MSAVDLELAIRRSGASYVADASLTRSDSHPESVLAVNVPVAVDSPTLLALALDVTAYGQALTSQLFPEPLRDAWGRARAFADGAGRPLRLRLRLDVAVEELHALRWETLRDPLDGLPLGHSPRRPLVRYIPSADLTVAAPGPRPALHALVVVASPRDLGTYGLAEIDVGAEVARLRVALGDISYTVVGQHPDACLPHATLAAIREGLQAEPTLLCLICHGRFINGESVLYLEGDDGSIALVQGSRLVEALTQSDRRPLLIVLAACMTGGRSHDPGALAALGPRLAREGSSAVVAMQDIFSFQSSSRFLSTLLAELRADGRIDRAVAVARASIQEAHDWWVPTLWLRVRDGRLWQSPNSGTAEDTALDPPALAVEHVASPPSPAVSLTRREQRYRRVILSQVRTSIEDRLRARLDGALPLELRLTWQIDGTPAGQPPCDRAAGHLSTTQLTGADLVAAFENAQGVLLLGAPGSGKSTQLLRLCRDLLARAERDPVAHIPVVFDLGSWSPLGVPLSSWMAGQLTSRAYNLTWERAEELIAGDEIAPLFDGLDEVEASHRAACVSAINNYRRDHLVPLAVAVRANDCATLEQPLNLQRVVLVEPLTDAQIQAALQAGGVAGNELLAVTTNDSELHDLLSTPLLLQLALQARLSSLPNTEQITWHVSSVLNSYITRMFHERGPAEPQGRRRILQRLRWVARRLRGEHQRVFYVEHLQPKDIRKGRVRTLYKLIVRALLALTLVVATVVANLLAAAVALVLLYVFSPAPAAMVPSLSIAALMSLAVMAFFSFFLLLAGVGASEDRIRVVTRLRWDPAAIRAAVRDEMQTLVQIPWRKVIGPIAVILFVVLGCSALSGQFLVFLGFCASLIIGVPASTALTGVVRGLCDDDVLRLRRPSEGIAASAQTSGLVWLITVLVLGGGVLVSVLSSALPSSAEGLVLNVFLAVAFISWVGVGPALAFGGQVIIKHAAVRLALWLSAGFPIRLPVFLDTCVQRALLRRVGGGYEFPHGLLQEHIADLDDADLVHLAGKL